MSKNMINKKNIETMRNLASRKNEILKNEGIINFYMTGAYRKIRDVFNIKYKDDIFEIHLNNETFDQVAKNKKTYTDEDDFIYYYDKNKKVLFFTIIH